jgi:type II secretory pathway component GspD/PulD (secretin)
MLTNQSYFKLLIAVLTCLVISSASATEKEQKIPFIEFKQAKIQDAVGLLADIADINVAATLEASQRTVNFRMKNTSPKGIIDTMARVSGLWYRYMRSTDSYLLMTAEQYQSDIVVFRDDLVRTFELRHQNVEAAAKTIRNLYGERVILTLEYKNDDFIGLPFEEVEDALISNISSSSSNGSSNSSSGNSTNNQNSRGDQNSNQQYGQNSNQQNGQNNQQNTSKGENGTVSGEQLATLGNFAQDSRKQNLLTSGQLNSLQGQQSIQDQQVAKVTDAQTPIYITVNRIHNLLFIRSTDEAALNEISGLIEISDKPTPQVLFEMEIIEIRVGDSFDQAFDISFNSAGKIDNFNIQSETDDAKNTSPFDVTTDNFGLNLSEPMAANKALPLAAILRGENVHSLVSNASGGIYSFINDQVNAQVELLKKNGQARTLSKPVLLASNNRQAKIFIGDEQIIATGIGTNTSDTVLDNNGNAIISGGQTQVETERRKIGNTLYLMPSINADRTITIDILQDKSKIIRNGTQLPYFDQRAQTIKHQTIDSVNQANVKTVVIAKDGLTVALGGMVSSSTSLQTSKVPILGDIPFLGALFTQEKEVNESFQYIMLITPHIIMTPEETADKSRKIAGFDYSKNANHNNEEPYPDYGFDRYIELTKFAIDAMSNIENKHTKQTDIYNNIIPVHDISGSASAIFPVHGISAKANAVWQQDNLFVSAFKLHNHTPIAQNVASSSLRGNWLSATILQEELSPFAEEGDTTWLYLVSDKPFKQVIEQIEK